MAPSANFKALDAIHSTKIHAILWAKKFAKQASSKELSLSDKCRQTQILIKALLTASSIDLGSILSPKTYQKNFHE